MKSCIYKESLGGGYGINRGMKGSSHLTTAIPPHSHVTVKPGLGKITPGAPKSGHGKVKPAKFS